MSLYADYLKEREGKEVVEYPNGFVIYTLLKDLLYIVDIYVDTVDRKRGFAGLWADQLCKDIKQKHGISKLVGSVDITALGATDSMKVLLAYGMKVDSIGGNVIYFTKDF